MQNETFYFENFKKSKVFKTLTLCQKRLDLITGIFASILYAMNTGPLSSTFTLDRIGYRMQDKRYRIKYRIYLLLSLPASIKIELEVRHFPKFLTEHNVMQSCFKTSMKFKL